MNKLNQIEAAQPECAALTGELRGLAHLFQFDAMMMRLADADAGVTSGVAAVNRS